MNQPELETNTYNRRQTRENSRKNKKNKTKKTKTKTNKQTKQKNKGALHYTKISANFGRNINGTPQSRWKFWEESGPPPEVVFFDRSVWFDRNLPFHFQKFSFPVPLS